MLASVIIIASSRTTHSTNNDLIGYGLFALAAVALLAVVFLLFFTPRWARRFHMPPAQLIAGPSVCVADLKVNTQLILDLLRGATPGSVLAWVDGEPHEEAALKLERFLTVLGQPYEVELTGAASDGNTYLALARAHAVSAKLVLDLERLCERLTALEARTMTVNHVSVVATRTTVWAVGLLCAFGGALFAAVAVLR